ncbi:MAG: multiheme c-type cytochrome [Planctomycetota bacterium]
MLNSLLSAGPLSTMLRLRTAREPTGYKTSADAALKGTGCETCHGPGSKHSEICRAFGKEKLNEAQEKEANDSIWSMLPRNVCVECHKTESHLESETPKELRTKK